MAPVELVADELTYERIEAMKPTWKRHPLGGHHKCGTALKNNHKGEWSAKQLDPLGQGIYLNADPFSTQTE